MIGEQYKGKFALGIGSVGRIEATAGGNKEEGSTSDVIQKEKTAATQQEPPLLKKLPPQKNTGLSSRSTRLVISNMIIPADSLSYLWHGFSVNLPVYLKN